MASVLYISYTGALQPLGESQVVAYLERLARDHCIHLLTFERPADLSDVDRMAAMASRLDSTGIGWTPLRYHRGAGPASTAWDVAQGRRAALQIARSIDADLVHCRSYVPSLMGLHVKRRTGARFLFDMRGFWVDERVDGGMWRKNGTLYRIGKRYERAFYRGADAIVSLTEAGARIVRDDVARLGGKAPCTVIPTCADVTRFCHEKQRPLSPLHVAYLGSAGRWYRFEETALALADILRRRPDTQIRIANRADHSHVRACLQAAGVSEENVQLSRLRPDQIPELLGWTHATVFFTRTSHATQAAAPTKLAEFMASGVPCLTNWGVGDVGDFVETRNVGVALRDLEGDSLKSGVTRFLTMLDDDRVHERCRDAALEHFDISRGASLYDSVYASIGGA